LEFQKGDDFRRLRAGLRGFTPRPRRKSAERAEVRDPVTIRLTPGFIQETLKFNMNPDRAADDLFPMPVSPTRLPPRFSPRTQGEITSRRIITVQTGDGDPRERRSHFKLTYCPFPACVDSFARVPYRSALWRSRVLACDGMKIISSFAGENRMFALPYRAGAGVKVSGRP
jgi:hypothetical protein